MCAAWLFLSGRHKDFDCEDCTDDLKRARNCNGEYGHKNFVFQIGKIAEKGDIEDKVVLECPRGRINGFEETLWRSYQDSKFKKEFGIPLDGMSCLKFEAFKIFENASEEHKDFERERDSKKVKRRSRGRRN